MNRYDYHQHFGRPAGYWPPLFNDWNITKEQKAICMKEMRAYWVSHWFTKKIPQIRKTLMVGLIDIPEVVIDIIIEYLPYPYQIKKM